MKAAIVPAANSRWEVKQLDTPETGPNQVLIKMHASGICFTDVHQTRGELRETFRARSGTNRWAKSPRSDRV
jgi:alcohol dehydrogenase